MAAKPRNIKEFEDSILNQVVIESKEIDQESLRIKVDVLERILELVRFHNALGANKTSMRDILRVGFKMEGKLIRYGVDGQAELQSTLDPKKPSDLQIHLLGFLLCNHVPDEQIFMSIERFIGKIHPMLTPLDFERTKTGVMRCYTATRFASGDLRNCGLLKVTEKELFKTWELSFFGVVVAISAYEAYDRDEPMSVWKHAGKAMNKLHGGIHNFVCDSGFISEAERVMTDTLLAPDGASPENIQLSGLRKLIGQFQTTFRDTDLKAAERTRILTSISAEIDQLPGMMVRLHRMVSPRDRPRDFKFDVFFKGFGQSPN